MSLTIELPRPLDQALAEEAQREGISAEEHAALLVVLTMALLKEESPTPFQEAVKSFLANRALDANEIASALEDLAHLCLQSIEGSSASLSSQEALADSIARRDFVLLTRWRNAIVHGVDVSPAAILSSIPPSQACLQAPGGVHRQAKAGKEEIPNQRTTEPTRPARKPKREHPPPPRDVKPRVDEENAASIALLQSWLEEDATDDLEEMRKAQQELDEFKRAINEERERAGARRIYP